MRHLGIITALLPEARCFVNNPVRNESNSFSNKISLIPCGMGQQRAEVAANKILDLGADSLLSVGTCGALSPRLKPGDIIMPELVITDIHTRMEVTAAWHHAAFAMLMDLSVPLYTQALLSTGKVIRQSVEKKQIHTDTGAIAVDMESAAIINVAQTRRVPVLVLRTVIDPLEFSIPDFVLNNSDHYGETQLFSLLKSCIVNPLRFGPLFRLAAYYRSSKKSLDLISGKLGILANLNV